MATFLRCPKKANIVPMHVVGGRCCAEKVLWGMIESSSALRGMDFNQFTFEETDGISLDPGGMAIIDDPRFEIELHGAIFYVKRQHLVQIEALFHPDEVLEERLTGWYRVGMGWSNVYIPTMLRISLYEAVKRERIAQTDAIRDQIKQLRTRYEELAQTDSRTSAEAGRLISGNLAQIEAEINKLESEERWSF